MKPRVLVSSKLKRESQIITLSYGLNNHKVCNLNEILNLLDITNERDRQIKSSALLKLKCLLSGEILFKDNI
jgi:DNA-directed RNA polymerase sigma subunit (sigma70/sigma32)